MKIFDKIKALFSFRKPFFYCPSCGAYSEKNGDCTDCMVPMLPLQKSNAKPEYIKMVPIYKPTGFAQLAVAKSILEEAGIAYFVKNEASQNLFGVGLSGIGFNIAAGEMVIQVDEKRAEEALLLLQQLE